MPPPVASWTTVPVYGTWKTIDGNPKTGTTIEASIPVRVVNTDDDGETRTIFPKGQITPRTTVDSNGHVSIDVPSNDDPNNSPNGWQVTVTVRFTDSSQELYVIDTPEALADDGIDLGTIVIVESIPAPTPVLIRGVAGGIAELDIDGDVIDANGDKVVAGGPGASPLEDRGAWATATAYAVNEVVTFDGTRYVATVAHTANAAFGVDLAADRWVAVGIDTASAVTLPSRVGVPDGAALVKDGATALAWGPVVVENPDAPVIDLFAAAPDSGAAPLDVTFTANVTDGASPVTSVVVDPDDGTADVTLTEGSPGVWTGTHEYEDAGTYGPVATASDGTLQDTASDVVTVTGDTGGIVEPYNGASLDAMWTQAKDAPNTITVNGSGLAVNLGLTYAGIIAPMPGDGELAITLGGPVGNDTDGTASDLSVFLLIDDTAPETNVLYWNGSGGTVELYPGPGTFTTRNPGRTLVAGDIVRAVFVGDTVQMYLNADALGAVINLAPYTATIGTWDRRGWFINTAFSVRGLVWTPA